MRISKRNLSNMGGIFLCTTLLTLAPAIRAAQPTDRAVIDRSGVAVAIDEDTEPASSEGDTATERDPEAPSPEPKTVPSTPTTPAPKFFFAGHWECTGTVTHPHTNLKHNTVGHLKLCVKKGGWVVDKFDNHTAEGKTYHSMGWAHYDELTKTINRYSVSNMGHWSRSVSQGWDGDDFTWTGKMHHLLPKHPQVDFQEVMHRVDDDTFTATVTVSHDQKAWEMYKGECKRHHHH